jgi:hypothetical protein
VNTDLLRHCALPRHPHKIEPHEIPLRRCARFMGELGVGGLYDAFLRIKNDELVYFGDVVDWLITAIPGLDRRAVVKRFQLGVRYCEFGFRGRFGQTTDLLDLDNFSAALPGQYALRPFIGGRTRDSSEQMRARKSRWATWLSSQGWPVPGWLAGAPVIEGEAVTAATVAEAAQEWPVPTEVAAEERGREATNVTATPSTQRNTGKQHREEYRRWLVPLVKKTATLSDGTSRSPEDIARVVRSYGEKAQSDGKSIEPLPKQFRSVVKAVMKILDEL